MAKALMLLGCFLLAIGALLFFLPSFSLGKLPGDFSFKTKTVHFYFPLTTSLFISLIFSLLLYLFTKS